MGSCSHQEGRLNVQGGYRWRVVYLVASVPGPGDGRPRGDVDRFSNRLPRVCLEQTPPTVTLRLRVAHVGTWLDP